MTGFSLRKNMVFSWNDEEFRIDRITPGGDTLLECVAKGSLSVVPGEQLLAEFGKGQISAKTKDLDLPDAERLRFSRPLAELPEKIRLEVTRRMRYVEIICKHAANPS